MFVWFMFLCWWCGHTSNALLDPKMNDLLVVCAWGRCTVSDQHPEPFVGSSI